MVLSTLVIGGCKKPDVSLTTSVTPVGSGTVSPIGGTYKNGDQVTLVATPTKNYSFSGWAGDISGTTNPITIKMNSNKNIVASFAKIMYNLQMSVDNSGNGTVDPKSGSFEAGSTVKVTASPATGYRFDHWSGSVSGTTNPLSVLMDGEKTVTAYFIQQYSLTTSSNPANGGNVSPSNGIYDKGAQVSLTANQLFPYAFVNWTGTDNNNAYTTTVTMSGNKSVTGNYALTTPGNWITSTNVPIYSSNSASFTINLQLYQFAEIQITGGIFTTQIKDPNGKVLQSFNTQTVNYIITALVAGQYTVVMQNTNTLTNTAYNSQCRIYTH